MLCTTVVAPTEVSSCGLVCSNPELTSIFPCYWEYWRNPWWRRSSKGSRLPCPCTILYLVPKLLRCLSSHGSIMITHRMEYLCTSCSRCLLYSAGTGTTSNIPGRATVDPNRRYLPDLSCHDLKGIVYRFMRLPRTSRFRIILSPKRVNLTSRCVLDLCWPNGYFGMRDRISPWV